MEVKIILPEVECTSEQIKELYAGIREMTDLPPASRDFPGLGLLTADRRQVIYVENGSKGPRIVANDHYKLEDGTFLRVGVFNGYALSFRLRDGNNR